MNTINFNQSVGFPLETETLDAMQKCWNILNAFGEIVAPLAIIKGCVVTGSNVSDGFVYINGELLKFVGGAIQTTVIIVQNPTSVEFEDGNSHEVYFERYATFGSGVTNYAWANFKRGMPTADIPQALAEKAPTTAIDTINNRLEELEAKTAVFQSGGGMVLWNKPVGQIPTGWAEVVDWRGRIPVGLDATQTEFDALGKQGGAKTKILSTDEMPAHRHKSIEWVSGNKAINTNGIGDYVASSPHISSSMTGSGKENMTSQEGDSQEFSIMNPYRVVMFIEWVGID